jgi:hypothetical protein
MRHGAQGELESGRHKLDSICCCECICQRTLPIAGTFSKRQGSNGLEIGNPDAALDPQPATARAGENGKQDHFILAVRRAELPSEAACQEQK